MYYILYMKFDCYVNQSHVIAWCVSGFIQVAKVSFQICTGVNSNV